jgi:hypothetical protein
MNVRRKVWAVIDPGSGVCLRSNISADRIREITGVSVGGAYRMGGTDGIDPEALLDQVDALMFDGPCSQPLPAAEAARLREHIAALLDEHRLTMRKQIRWRDAYADMEAREIVVRPVDCEVGYFVALHDRAFSCLGFPLTTVGVGCTTTRRPSTSGRSTLPWWRRQPTPSKN